LVLEVANVLSPGGRPDQRKVVLVPIVRIFRAYRVVESDHPPLQAHVRPPEVQDHEAGCQGAYPERYGVPGSLDGERGHAAAEAEGGVKDQSGEQQQVRLDAVQPDRDQGPLWQTRVSIAMLRVKKWQGLVWLFGDVEGGAKMGLASAWESGTAGEEGMGQGE